ncbi:MAG TPA: HD domain-containing phosphohydrolase [Gemmatimonadales bacterium]|nr:HD domain-containing phosphohydrolase [Gemmatimonadales bacterium]
MFDVTESRILIVDDDASVVRSLRQILARHGFGQIASTTDPHLAKALFQEFSPDIVVLDLRMPGLDGFAVMEQLTPLVPEESYLPILILTGESSTEIRRRALAAGAHDFLEKPFDVVEVDLRIRHLLQTRLLHLRLANQNQTLEMRVRERTRQRDRAQEEMLQRLAAAGEARDDETGQHTQRVGHLAADVARALGLPEAQVELIRRAAPLHDIGKIGIPDAVLLKPGKLSQEEFAIMKRHTIIGARILADGQCDVVQLAASIARHHHERWDGTGYPDGLVGEAIPIEARIVALVDVFDALTHDRPYRPAWPPQKVCEYLTQESGRHFDPAICEVFVAEAMAPAQAQAHRHSIQEVTHAAAA